MSAHPADTTLAAMFPGQGTQFVGMGRDLASVSPAAAETFAQADAALGFSLSSVCWDGPAERLNRTDLQQPAVFTVSVAMFRAACAAGVLRPDAFAILGGLSLGEYTALHIGGSLDFEDGVRLLYRRGQLMQEAADRVASGMVALSGLDEAAALRVCERVKDHGRIWPANYNCPGQIVLSGEAAACQAALALAEEFGCRMTPLSVAGAFHCDLMRPAADGLRPLLDACAFRPPTTPVVSNVDGELHRDGPQIREWLYRQTFAPVRWQACMQRMVAMGCGRFYEIGPGRTLSGMMKRLDRRMPTVNLSSAGDLTTASPAAAPMQEAQR